MPSYFPGWPEGKQFAFALTHDVEGQCGVNKCRQLMELEAMLGFRSSFNFIPEGDYQVSRELRDELTSQGFEVGVHDLHHDGKLYRSRAAFAEHALGLRTFGTADLGPRRSDSIGDLGVLISDYDCGLIGDIRNSHSATRARNRPPSIISAAWRILFLTWSSIFVAPSNRRRKRRC